MPKDPLKNIVDKLADDPKDIELSFPPEDYDHSKDEIVPKSKERSYRARGGKINEYTDRLQNQAVKELELGKALKEGKKKAPRVERKFEPTELVEPMSAEEMATRTKQALKATAKDEASGIQALKRSRAEYKANLNKALSEGRSVSPPIKSEIMPTVLTRKSRAVEERFLKDQEIHAQFQAGLKEQMKEYKTLGEKAPKLLIKAQQIPAPSREEIPKPKKVRLSGNLGPMREPTAPSIPKRIPQDKTLGNLETKSVYPPINRDLSIVFDEPYMGDRPRGEIPKEQMRTWLLRLKPVGESAAEETSSEYMTKVIEGAKTSTDEELKDMAKRLRHKKATQSSIDRELAAKAGGASAEKPVELSGVTGEEGVKRYKEIVPTPTKPTVSVKSMLSGKAAELPGAVKLAGKTAETGAVALSDTSKIVRAAEAGGEAASLASKSARLSELLSKLGKGAGKAGIAALILGGGMAGLKKIGAKLEE